MSRVDQAEEAVKFMEDHIHEERLDKILWAARMRRDQAALQVPEWE
jgi:L-lactate dehydrogenase complex protein LldF